MFLDDFQSGRERSHKQKQAKKEYSAGFKNYHPPKSTPSTDAPFPNEDDLLFSQLKIGNLKELYLQTLPQQDHRQQKCQQQKESTVRLSLKPKQPKEEEENEQDEKQRKEEMEQKFMKTYHKVEKYQEKANRILFLGEFKKMRDKVAEAVRKVGKSTISESIFVNFLMSRLDVYKKKDKISNDELLLDLANYLNRIAFGQKTPTIQFVKSNDVKDLARKNLFLVGYFNMKRCEDRQLTAQKLKILVRKNEEENQIDWALVEQLIEKKITVPYQSQLYRSYKQKEVKSTTKQEKEQHSSDICFHAKPIPKTTYEKPKERPKSQMSKTRAQPFNLTVTTSNMPKMEDLYNWDRNFHPKEIPQTTYKPQTIQHLSDDEKKMRALQLIHTSSYPSTMKYLNNLNQVMGQKKEELEKKYTKERKMEEVRPVPNFQMIHKRHLEASEECTIQKRQLTVPQPFNLSQARKPKDPVYQLSDFRQEGEEPRKIRRFDSQPKMKPASTLKFQSYVNHRKKQKQQKLQKEDNKKKEKQKKDNKQCTQILKNRVYCELGKSPKPVVYPQQPLAANSVKVNLENIYNSEPLLMEREAMKSKKYGQVPQKTWQPII